MAQDYTVNCYTASDVADTNLNAMERNFECIRSSFGGAAQPSNPVGGQLWYNTSTYVLYMYTGSLWVTVYDFSGDQVAAGKVRTASIAAGALDTSVAGRAKMANGYITSAHVNDVDGSKIVNNSLLPAKLYGGSVTPSWCTPGFGILAEWNAVGPGASWIDANVSVAEIAAATWTPFVKFYRYIPLGTKYLAVLGKWGSSYTTCYGSITISGVRFGNFTLPTSPANSGSPVFDVSAYVGNLHEICFEVYHTDYTCTSQHYHFGIQYWGG